MSAVPVIKSGMADSLFYEGRLTMLQPSVQPDGDWLIKLMCSCTRLLLEYNSTSDAETEKREQLLTQLLGSRGERLRIRVPFYANFGKNIFLGENCYINMNCTFLDDDKITIGDYAMIAPDVKIYTAFHPMTAEERWSKKRVIEGFEYPVTYSASVTIGKNVWIGGASIILPGVTIGDDCVIGAGSVVSKDIPAKSIACGTPCKVLRPNDR